MCIRDSILAVQMVVAVMAVKLDNAAVAVAVMAAVMIQITAALQYKKNKIIFRINLVAAG